MASFLSAAVLITAVQGLALGGNLARPTGGLIPNPTFQAPKVTIPPSLRDLAKRQDEQTILWAPDNTCGYLDGRPGAAYSCVGSSYTCALLSVSATGAVACCDTDVCGIALDCVDYESYYYSSACDIGCAQDTFTVKCTRSSAPYCGTVTVFDGIVDYYCDSLDYSTPQQLYTTYDGEDDGRTFSTFVASGDEDLSTSFVGTHQTASPTSASDDDDDSSSTSAAGAGSTSSSDDDSDSGSSVDPPEPKKSSTNIGAIVGGVVGGVAGLALIGLGIFFLVRHNQKKKQAAAAAAAGGAPGQPPAPQMQQGPGPNGPPVAAAAGYPHYSQQYSPQLQQQQGYYSDPSKPGGFTSVAPTVIPDRNDSTSPVSQFTDNRMSTASPTSTVNSGWPQQQQQQPGVVGGYPGPQQQQQQQGVLNVPPTVHEAGGNAVGERDYNGNYHGQLHEMS
ncbi:hypothetical protein M426DRAFT_140061 [Hypoxylon sp. CI-4A]|nr:hypothetical protein M426DRAFT_140061 [Hypoxylon sp. CI-4A]